MPELRAAIPRVHTSAFSTLGPLEVPAGHALEDESPLFAADLVFARAHGGPLTRAFLDTLPLEGEPHVVVDSSLVWLSPGLVHGFELARGSRLLRPRGLVRFGHEPFPGVASGVRGAANRNLDAVHFQCVLGLPCTPEVAQGELAFSCVEEAEAFWLPRESLEPREDEIERRLIEGSLRLDPLPAGVVVRFGWGALRRPRKARTHGFQLILRATARDPRPIVNGLRNHSML